MPAGIEINLSTNGDFTKLQWWSNHAKGPSKMVGIRSDLLRRRGQEVRDALTSLNTYVLGNPNLREEQDTGWKSYCETLQKIKDAGRALRRALFQDERTKELEALLAKAEKGTGLQINWNDDDVTLPFGFICDEDGPEGDEDEPEEHEAKKPSLEDFAGFWLSRFTISYFVAGSGCAPDDLSVNPISLRTLYALHEVEYEAAAHYLGPDRDSLRQLLTVDVGLHHDWNKARKAWKRVHAPDGIVFVLAHSDGDHLQLAGSTLDCLRFGDMLRKNSETGAILLILSCCLSVRGAVGASLLSVVAQRGFCGLIGTEAEILNTVALRFGTRLLWRLCTQAETLGQAFDAVQRDPELFPLSLLYSCYADRSFKLSAPLTFEMRAA